MVYLVLIYALIYTLGEFVSRRIGLPHSVTFAGLAVFLAAALILYRRRYGLGACRRGRKRWPGLLLLLLWLLFSTHKRKSTRGENHETH